MLRGFSSAIPVRHALLCAAALLVLPFACADDDDDPDPVALCSELCSRNNPDCPRDGTLAQCQLDCERWYRSCPGPASVYYGCYNSQFRVDVVCDDRSGRSRLADGLCAREQEEFDQCLDGR